MCLTELTSERYKKWKEDLQQLDSIRKKIASKKEIQFIYEEELVRCKYYIISIKENIKKIQ